MRPKLIVVVVVIVFGNLLFCNETNKVIRGKVIDELTNQNIISANVIIEGTNTGTITNGNGEFSIASPIGKFNMLISYVGYKTAVVQVNDNDSTLVVKLKPVNLLLQEVSVFAKQKKSEEISSTELQNEQIKDLAGMTKDALRSVQLLPGVSVDNEASAKINVRGGTSDENLVLINGVEVYNPYHLKEVSMASVGIFNIDMVKSIDFSAGGFSAKYGDALSSLTKIDYSEGDRNNYKGKVDLSLVDLSCLVQGPINHNGSFIFGIRKSYLDYLMRITNISSAIYMSYYDIQGQIDYDLSKLNKLKIDIILSKDNAYQNPTNTFSQYGNYEGIQGKNTLVSQLTNQYKNSEEYYSNTMFSINSNNIISGKLTAQTLLSYYNEVENEHEILVENTDFKYSGFPDYWSNNSNNDNLADNLTIRTLTANQDFNYQASPFFNLDAGINYKRIFYDYNSNMIGVHTFKSNVSHFPDTTIFVYPPDPSYNDTANINTPAYSLAGYIQQTLQIEDNMILNAGVRFDYFDMSKQTKYAPRVSVSYLMPLGITLRTAWGIFYQPPSYKQLRSTEASSDNTGFEKASQYIFGLEKKFPNNNDLRVEFYQKYYSDLIPTIRLGDGSLAYGLKQNNAVGYAKGMDIQYTARFNKIDLWFSYGYLVAKEKLINSNQGYYPRYTDQRHTLSAAIIFYPGNEWTINLRGFYGSGYAYTPYAIQYDSTRQINLWVPGDENSNHYPAYERVDLRVSRNFFVYNNPLEVYVDIMNIFNKQNTMSYTYTFDESGRPEIQSKLLFGMIPTLGISYSF